MLSWLVLLGSRPLRGRPVPSARLTGTPGGVSSPPPPPRAAGPQLRSPPHTPPHHLRPLLGSGRAQEWQGEPGSGRESPGAGGCGLLF